MSIVVRTLSEQVFEIVREQIVTGKLVGHAAIRQDALATELGVSKIPLREALARLEQEGLLTSHANRGYSVQPMSADEADDIFALRLAIEPQAAAYAATVANDEDRATAILAFEELDNAASERLAEVAIRNRVFHTALVRPGRRLLTTQMVERLAILAERYVVAHLRPAGRESRAHLEHRQLLDAWLARDDDRMLTLLTSHIQSTLTDLRMQFDTGRD
ncbi:MULTISPECIES: GntR family transcriptional regulator [unclassified Sphingomonas]|jgi:DNA-binding GntR family transcriptional regulator|uniref:GntR family transcriptional regulator n=1 Tax=unclassified Sphingomonas TaxID=196159 RepID=UPI0006F469D4|nr:MULTISPECIES: GntR family transcriptional regulator [unclassified Sphingomonas]KQN27128.1 GntR family transcriptional regulator [Sphingomonas sp. Leaf34]KQN31085.1 GntR family transcriptional regulator [Sphingomonas sp. Leaf38]